MAQYALQTHVLRSSGTRYSLVLSFAPLTSHESCMTEVRHPNSWGGRSGDMEINGCLEP